MAFSGKFRKTIELPSMAKQALKSHIKGKKHIPNSKTITYFFQVRSVPRVQPVITGIDNGPFSSF